MTGGFILCLMTLAWFNLADDSSKTRFDSKILGAWGDLLFGGDEEEK